MPENIPSLRIIKTTPEEYDNIMHTFLSNYDTEINEYRSYPIYNCPLEKMLAAGFEIASMDELHTQYYALFNDTLYELPESFDEEIYCSLQNFYYTFGSNEQFPYPNQYLIITAPSLNVANDVFKSLHPHPYSDECLNCSFYYTQEQWAGLADDDRKPVCQYYQGVSPAEHIYAVDSKHFHRNITSKRGQTYER